MQEANLLIPRLTNVVINLHGLLILPPGSVFPSEKSDQVLPRTGVVKMKREHVGNDLHTL